MALLEAGSSALCCCKGVSQLSHSLPALLAITPPRLCSASSPNIPRRPSSSQSAWLGNLGSDSPPHSLHCALNFPWGQKADPPHSLHFAFIFPWGQPLFGTLVLIIKDMECLFTPCWLMEAPLQSLHLCLNLSCSQKFCMLHPLHSAFLFPWMQKADPPHSLHCALNFPWGQCLGFFIRDSPPACRGRPCSSKSACLPGKPVPITPDSGTLVVMIKHMECAHPRRT